MESCCICISSVGPIEDCCVMLLLRFPPARKCLVGTFESFLCGLAGFAKTCIGPILRVLQLWIRKSTQRQMNKDLQAQKVATKNSRPSCKGARSIPKKHLSYSTPPIVN